MDRSNPTAPEEGFIEVGVGDATTVLGIRVSPFESAEGAIVAGTDEVAVQFVLLNMTQSPRHSSKDGSIHPIPSVSMKIPEQFVSKLSPSLLSTRIVEL